MMDWRDKLRKGDIIRSAAGTERVVREAHYRQRKGSGLLCVTCTILNCSWTERCYTFLFRADLAKFRPTGKRKRLTSPQDKLVARAIRESSRSNHWKVLNCCTVEGIR